MELVFLALLFVLMMYALGSGFPVAFALPGSAIVTIVLAGMTGHLIEGDSGAYFIQDGPIEWLTAGVTNFRGIYWEVERDTLIAIPLFRKANSLIRFSKVEKSKISGTMINKSVISDGCIIKAAKIERCVIGIRSTIGKESTVLNTYMMGNDYYESIEKVQANKIDNLLGVGDRCHINNCIIDKNCRIGDDVRINGGKHLKDAETDSYLIKDGIVVIKKGATIPKGTVI